MWFVYYCVIRMTMCMRISMSVCVCDVRVAFILPYAHMTRYINPKYALSAWLEILNVNATICGYTYSVIGFDPKDRRRRKPNTIPIIALINRPCAVFTVKKKLIIILNIQHIAAYSIVRSVYCTKYSRNRLYIYTVHTTHCLYTRVLYT